MTDDRKSSAETENAAIRRRWITLAEILGVAGVIISGLALWNSYQERTSQESEEAASRREATARAQTLVLRGTPDREGSRLAVSPTDADQNIQSQVIAFPTALAIAPIETVADPRIEARWFRGQLLRAIAGNEENGSGGEADRRLPIAITTSFYRDGSMFRDSAVYALVYRVEGGGLFEGSEVRLRGLARLQPVGAGDRTAAQILVDRMWAERPRRQAE